MFVMEEKKREKEKEKKNENPLRDFFQGGGISHASFSVERGKKGGISPEKDLRQGASRGKRIRRKRRKTSLPDRLQYPFSFRFSLPGSPR